MSIEESANAEFVEMSKIVGEFKHVGDAYVTTKTNGVVISHTLFHVQYTIIDELIPQNHPAFGELYWDEIYSSDPTQYFPGFLDIYAKVQAMQTDKFFEEFNYDL
jgi:hypothetical protein